MIPLYLPITSQWGTLSALLVQLVLEYRKSESGASETRWTGFYIPQSMSTSGEEHFQSSKCPRNILAQCVWNPLHVLANWQNICWPTLERSCTNVQNATNHSVKLEIWRITCLYTEERSSTNVQNVTNLSAELEILSNICRATLEWSCTNVHNATNHSVNMVLWRGISLHTAEKSCSNVENVTNLSAKL